MVFDYDNDDVVNIESEEELEEFINSATKEELIQLREDIISGKAFEDD